VFVCLEADDALDGPDEDELEAIVLATEEAGGVPAIMNGPWRGEDCRVLLAPVARGQGCVALSAEAGSGDEVGTDVQRRHLQ